MIISEEIADRSTLPKEELLIKSLYDNINLEKKTWINDVYMCDENGVHQTKIEDNNCIIVKSIENYIFKIEIDNEKNTTKIIEVIEEVDKTDFANITFDVNAVKGQGTMEPQSVKKEQNTKLAQNTFTRNRYIFKEWNTNADGTGTSYEDEAEIKIKEDITLYAIWIPNVSKTYLYNDGQTNSEIKSIEQYVYSGMEKAGTFTVHPTYLSVRKNSSNGEWDNLYLTSNGSFDFTGFSKLYCSFSSMTLTTAQEYTDGKVRPAWVRFGISTSNTNTSFNIRKEIKSPSEHNAVTKGAHVLEVDISGFDNFGFLKFCCCTVNWLGQGCDFDIDKIWVE